MGEENALSELVSLDYYHSLSTLVIHFMGTAGVRPRNSLVAHAYRTSLPTEGEYLKPHNLKDINSRTKNWYNLARELALRSSST